jgi:hypothetical protein
VDPLVEDTSLRFILAGQLRRDFIILPTGEEHLDILGGNLIYAAVGLAIWEPDPSPGLVARVGEDFSQDWLAECQRRGFDTRGVRVLPEAVDLRSLSLTFLRPRSESVEPWHTSPTLGQAFPKVLLGYQSRAGQPDSRTRPADVFTAG